MNTIEFIKTVLAPEDNYLLWLARRSGATWNENYTTAEACVKAALEHDKAKDVTVYMAIGSFADNIGPHKNTGKDYVQRQAHQATKFKTLAVDLDVDPDNPKKYSSQREAVKALLLACKKIGLPEPLIVLSGNGVHAYWIFTESIIADLWEKMSLSLRAAMEANGVKLDVSKVHERTMVLRPVGTHHKKDPDNWKEVHTINESKPRSPIEYAKVLKEYKFAGPKRTGAGPGRRRTSTVMDALLAGDANVVLADMYKCPQIAALLDSGGATDAAGEIVSEPLWRASLGIAKFCEDSKDAAVQLSSGHPDYDYDDCIEKMENWNGTGPTVCATFAEHCPSACDTCAHNGRITSPAQLVRGVSEIEVQSPISTETETQTVKLPAGYSFKSRNTYYRRPGSDEDEFVAPYMLWVEQRVTDADENTNSAKIAVDFPLEGIKVITIEASIIAAGGNDLRKALADKQVYINGNIDPLKNYLMTFLRRLQEAVAADVSYKHFGWQKDGSFLIGTNIIGADRETTPHLEGVAKDYEETLTQKGDLDTWVNATRLFDLPGMEFQGFCFLLALGAPLQKAAGFPSALVNMYSKDSGSGKTLTGRFGLSAWGDYRTLGATTKSTPAAFYKHFGTLSNFGIYVDEMTTMDTDRLRSFVMCIQDGVEPIRLSASATGFRDASRWCTPIITSSNTDMYAQLGQTVVSEAEELRILQFNCERVAYLADNGMQVGRKLQKLIEDNYGLAGPIFVEDLIKRGGPEAVFNPIYDEFDDAFKFTMPGQERFYKGKIVVAYAAGKLYSELGLIKFNYERHIRAVLKHILKLRKNRSTNVSDGFDILAQFLTENQSEIVYYYTTPTNSYALQPTPRNAVARVELTLDDKERVVGGMMFINRTAFRKWGQFNNTNSSRLVESLEEEGVKISYVRKTLYKGVQGASASGQTHCHAIDIMSHNRLISACDNTTEEHETVTGRQRLEEV